MLALVRGPQGGVLGLREGAAFAPFEATLPILNQNQI